MKKLLKFVFVFLLPLTALAEERIEVCAKYEKQYGWSKSYKVEGIKMWGHELNSKTSSFNYSAYSTYVVIFWDKDQASVIKMTSPYFSISQIRGTDQRGADWKIKEGHSFCY